MIPTCLITILSAFILGAFGYPKDFIDINLSKNSPSNVKCDENAIFPEPPCCGVSKKHSVRIYGGEKVELGEFPWNVLIYVFKNGHAGTGGGSLINSRWVLTAGHNVEGSLKVEVHLGTLKRQNVYDYDCVNKFCTLSVKKLKVEKIITHEEYVHSESYQVKHDIALLRLAEAVTFTDYIKPICLPLGTPEQYNFVNRTAVVAGWGRTESGSGSDVILKASVQVWDSLSCQQHARNVSIEICAGGVEGISACSGDSGGPLMLELENDVHKSYYQIGLVSYGNCGLSGFPTVYVNVPSYMQWINDTILNNQGMKDE